MDEVKKNRMSKHDIQNRYKKHFRLEFPSGGKIVCYYPFKSVQVLFYDIHSPNIPDLYQLAYRKVTSERYLRAFICRSGSCDFTLDEKTNKLSAGEVMYDFSVGDNGKFSFVSDYFKGVEIIIQLDSFDEESSLYKKFKPIIKSMKLPEKEMFQSDDYISTYSPDTEKRLDAFLDAGFEEVENIITVAHMILLGRSLGVDLKEKPTKIPKIQLLIAKDIYDCLTNELDTKWTASYFADKYKLSESTVKRYFKKVYGYGFMEYQTKAKMEYAAEMLVTSDISIGDIAAMVGFFDRAVFTNAFKKYHGCTPSEYRLGSGINA